MAVIVTYICSHVSPDRGSYSDFCFAEHTQVKKVVLNHLTIAVADGEVNVLGSPD